MPRHLELELFIPHFKLGFLKMNPAVVPIMGIRFADILEPLGTAPPREYSAGGTTWAVFRIVLPEGQGVDFPVPVLGNIGAHNDGGLLRLTVPAGLANQLINGPWKRWMVHTPRSRIGVGTDCWFKVEPGLSARFTIPKLGDVLVAHPKTPDPVQ